MKDSEEVLDVDLKFLAGRHDTYRQLRESGTVHRIRQPNGLHGWLITGYDACRSMLADPRLRKSVDGISECIEHQTGAPMTTQMRETSTHMLNSDPPDHSRLRRLIGDIFKPKNVGSLEPKIARIAAELLDDMVDCATVDLITSYTVPLPLRTICELLGVPFADRAMFLSWLMQMHSIASPHEDRIRGTASMWEYLTELVRDKRMHHGDDKLSELVNAGDADDTLSESELVSMAHLLLVAGHEAISGMLGNGLRIALQESDVRDALAGSEPTAALIEELLRFDGAIEMSTTRYTVAPVELDGVTIPAKSFVWMALGDANRDPAQFQNPDDLRVREHTEAHLAFGHGVHYCLGASLARLEAQIALSAFVRQYPGAALVEEASLTFQGGGLLPSRLTSLPVRLR